MKKILAVLMVLAMVLAVAATAEELTVVTLAMPRGLECLDDAHLLSAMYMGYFAEEGIDFHLVGTSGTDIATVIATGEVDMGYPNPNACFTALSQGMEFISVFQDGWCNIFGLAYRADSGIESWADVAGKTVAQNSATGYRTTDPMLIESGVDPEDVEYIVAGEQRGSYLATGVVDAAFTWQKEWQLWAAAYAADGIEIKYLDGDEVVKNVSNTLCCTQEYFDEHRDLVEGTCRAIAKGVWFAKSNPLAAATITVHKWPALGVSAEDAVAAVEAGGAIAINPDGLVGYQDIDRWQVNLDWAIYYELFDGDFDLAGFLHNDIVEAANDFDHDAVAQDAINFDCASVVDWDFNY